MIKVLIECGAQEDLAKPNRIKCVRGRICIWIYGYRFLFCFILFFFHPFSFTPYDYAQPKLRTFLFQFLPKDMQAAINEAKQRAASQPAEDPKASH